MFGSFIPLLPLVLSCLCVFANERPLQQNALQYMDTARGMVQSIKKHAESYGQSAKSLKQQAHGKNIRKQVDEYSRLLGVEQKTLPSDNPLETEYPLLFVSSSIPMVTLRNYLPDLEKAGGKMVLRGMVDGADKIKPTLRFMLEALRKHPECHLPDCELFSVEILVDPVLFREFEVDKVPALTLYKGEVSHCESSSNSAGRVIFGDRSLNYLIERWRDVFQ